MNIYFLLAGSVALGTVLVHCIRGGRHVVAPMLEAHELNDTVKTVLFGCWHAFTLLYLAIALGFFWAAWHPGAISLAYQGAGISVLLAGMSIVVILRFKQRFMRLPHWLMFSAVAIAGIVGLAE